MNTRFSRPFITGAAGFIGSSVADRCLEMGMTVTGYDNFSTGVEAFIAPARENDHYRLVRADVLDPETLTEAMAGCDFVFHFAANADVRLGTQHPRKDLEQNTIATFNVLEAMRANGIKRIAFSSTGSIYGEPEVFPTPEDAPFPVQTSLYGASKLAGEGLIQAYCEGFEYQGSIFRFVSLLGERYSHGHVFDFYKQLLEHPDSLHILGDGNQRKSYLYIQDCIDAMLTAIAADTPGASIYNLGTDGFITVKESVGFICEHLGLTPEFTFGGGERGWIGDSPFIFLDTAKVRGLGWEPKATIKDGVVRTVRYLQDNHWLLEQRS